MTSFEDLTVQLEKQLIEDRNRLHYEKNVLINELWEHEKKYLLQLPKVEYPVFKEAMGKVNKYNEITLDQVLVHVPRASNYSLLHVQLTWNSVKVISPDGEILLDDYRPYMKKRKALPWISIFKTWINKPRSVAYSGYKDYLPGRVKSYLLVEHLVIRRERLKAVASLLITHDMKRINEEFYELIAEERLGKEENPFEINWSDYDSLTASKEVTP